MKFEIELSSSINISDKISKVMEDFDIKLEQSNEHFAGNIDIDGKEWNIGLIVGGSGTGKTTIANECFGKTEDFQYDNSKSVFDNMPSDDIREIEQAFTSVGFSSPPSWLKPYCVLSTGEQMRSNLARMLLLNQDVIVCDEFTSVVDRDVAFTCSMAMQKAIRRKQKKFVAVSCHRDIVEYLNPDWIYDTDEQCFFGQRANMSAHQSKLTYTKLTDLISNQYGEYLGSIII